jgi:hypothetical protein
MGILPGAIAPLEKQFGCSELYELVINMEVWTACEYRVPRRRFVANLAPQQT